MCIEFIYHPYISGVRTLHKTIVLIRCVRTRAAKIKNKPEPEQKNNNAANPCRAETQTKKNGNLKQWKEAKKTFGTIFFFILT